MNKTCPNCRDEVFHSAPDCQTCGWDFLTDKLSKLRDDRIRPPYPFFGSKKVVADDLWRLFGGVKKYIEPFLGSAAMLRHVPDGRSVLCVVNDASRYISNFWRAMQYAPDRVAELVDYPVNEADLHARHAWLENQPFEETVAGTPGGDELLQRIRNMEEGLQSDPLWHDPLIAAWWVWGQCAWIGGGWCVGNQDRRSPELVARRGVHRQCRQVEANGCGGVLSRKLPGVNGRPETKWTKGVHRKRLATGHRKGVHTRRECLLHWFRQLQGCLRDAIVCCGSWERVVTPCVLGTKPCAVLLDPPYKDQGKGCYGRYHDNMISRRVKAWAVTNGANPNLRIALCEYEGVFEMPGDWSCYRWDHAKGMSNTGKNVGRERVWCSPGIRPLDSLERLVRVR